MKNKEKKLHEMRFSVTNNSKDEASYSINFADVKYDKENVKVIIIHFHLLILHIIIILYV